MTSHKFTQNCPLPSVTLKVYINVTSFSSISYCRKSEICHRKETELGVLSVDFGTKSRETGELLPDWNIYYFIHISHGEQT